MNSLIGISVRGKTYFFFNIFSKNQLLLLKDLATNYRENNLFIEKDDDTIIKQFILDANALLKCSLHLVDIEEILILK